MATIVINPQYEYNNPHDNKHLEYAFKMTRQSGHLKLGLTHRMTGITTVNIMTRQHRGFTLLELLLVILIISLLIGFVAPKIAGKAEETRRVSALRQISALETALREYNIKYGTFPTTEQGLKALVQKPESEPVPKNWKRLLSKKTLPKDPWGRDYQYRYPGEKEDFDVFSFGKNKDSDDDDIGNWDTSKASTQDEEKK